MTNSELALRAEQAMIGALLADPQHIRDSPNATLFLKHPTHQAIAREIDSAAIYLGMLENPTRLIERIAGRLELPGVDADYLHGLARACPDPADFAIYSRMVTEVHVRASLAAQADRIAITAGEPGEEYQAGTLLRLAEALRRQAPEPAIAESKNPAPEPYVNTAAPEPVAEAQPQSRARQEELILADLLQHRGQLSETEWLSPEVFVPGPRREIYETILTVNSYGEPVSELTVEWELDRRRAEARQQDQPESDQTDLDPGPGYVAQLAATTVAVGAAVEIGSQLLEDDLRATLAVEAAKILTRSAEPSPTAGVAASTQPHAKATAIQPGPESPHPRAVIALPPTPASASNQPDIRP